MSLFNVLVGEPILGVPVAPVIGTATIVSVSSATVTYTPVYNGSFTVTSYTAVSTPGGLTGTDTTSSGTITVTGLSTNTNYTFQVYATNAAGSGAYSASSNTVISVAGSSLFTSVGLNSWTAPPGVSNVSVVLVGAGGGGQDNGGGGAGGTLVWANNISVTPGTLYNVYVGAGGSPSPLGYAPGPLGYATATGGGLSAFGPNSVSPYQTNNIWAAGGGGGYYHNTSPSPGWGTSSGGGGAGGYSGTGGTGGQGPPSYGNGPNAAAYNGGNSWPAVPSFSSNAGGIGGWETYNLTPVAAPIFTGGNGAAAGGGGWWNSYPAPSSGGQEQFVGGGGVGLYGKSSFDSNGNPTTALGNWSLYGPVSSPAAYNGGSGGTSTVSTPDVPGITNGGLYGGGGGGGNGPGGLGGQGAVRIIWGVGKSFPDNAT